MQTNIEVLARQLDMPDSERRQIVAALTEEVDELTHLVDDLVELARDPDASTESVENVPLDEVVSQRSSGFDRAPATSRSSSWRWNRPLCEGNDDSSNAPSSTSSTTRASGARRGHGSRSVSPTAASRSVITAPASILRTCRTCSTVSTGPRRPGRRPAPASGLRSSAASSTSTPDRSASSPLTAAARSPRSRSPWPTASRAVWARGLRGRNSPLRKAAGRPAV